MRCPTQTRVSWLVCLRAQCSAAAQCVVFQYSTTAWAACSVTCGDGVKKRLVTCADNTGQVFPPAPLHRDGAHVSSSAPGSGSPLPPLHREWARPSHLCTGSGLTGISGRQQVHPRGAHCEAERPGPVLDGIPVRRVPICLQRLVRLLCHVRRPRLAGKSVGPRPVGHGSPPVLVWPDSSTHAYS